MNPKEIKSLKYDKGSWTCHANGYLILVIDTYYDDKYAVTIYYPSTYRLVDEFVTDSVNEFIERVSQVTGVTLS